MRRCWLFLLPCLMVVNQGFAQCATGGALWLNGENNGQMSDTGLLGNAVFVEAVTTGTMVSGRPLYAVGSSVWKGLNYASLQVYRAYSSPGSNRTSFKLSQPLDSTFFHVRVDNIRGDLFNWESQNVRGYLNGVEVPADFKDPINGATVSGNTISGPASTTSAVQSAMRVFFQGPVDSIVVRQTSVSDWIIAELQVACNVVLPLQLEQWYARADGKQTELGWVDITGTSNRSYTVQYATDGIHFRDLVTVPAGSQSPYRYFHTDPAPGKAYYRLRLKSFNGEQVYSSVKIVRIAAVQPMLIYPNPVKGWLSLQLPNVKTTIHFISMDCAVVHKISGNKFLRVNTSTWNKGMYIAVMETAYERVTQKILVE